jgi:hypothetical protein
VLPTLLVKEEPLHEEVDSVNSASIFSNILH